MRVFRPGVFDLLHVGHINCIKDAANQGDYLIVGVQDDRDVMREKGKWPIISLEQRMLILNEIKGVKEVISYRNKNISNLLKILKVDVLAVNEEYGTNVYFEHEDQIATLNFCNSNNIRVHRTPRTEYVSSTKIRKNVDFWNNIEIKNNTNATMLTSCNQDEETKKEIELILKHLNEKRNILDLGSGNGRLSISFMENHIVTCVDSSINLLNDLKSKTQIEKHQRFFVEDVVEFSTREQPEKYDAIIASGILPCLDDFDFNKVTKNIVKMLKKEGVLLVRTSVSATGNRINVINQFSDALNNLYTAYYRTIEETDLAFIELKKQEEIFLYANHIDTKVMFLKYQK